MKSQKEDGPRHDRRGARSAGTTKYHVQAEERAAAKSEMRSAQAAVATAHSLDVTGLGRRDAALLSKAVEGGVLTETAALRLRDEIVSTGDGLKVYKENHINLVPHGESGYRLLKAGSQEQYDHNERGIAPFSQYLRYARAVRATERSRRARIGDPTDEPLPDLPVFVVQERVSMRKYETERARATAMALGVAANPEQRRRNDAHEDARDRILEQLAGEAAARPTPAFGGRSAITPDQYSRSIVRAAATPASRKTVPDPAPPRIRWSSNLLGRVIEEQERLRATRHRLFGIPAEAPVEPRVHQRRNALRHKREAALAVLLDWAVEDDLLTEGWYEEHRTHSSGRKGARQQRMSLRNAIAPPRAPQFRWSDPHVADGEEARLAREPRRKRKWTVEAPTRWRTAKLPRSGGFATMSRRK